jgi:regulatory protein
VEANRSQALAVATRALARREFSVQGLRERLAQAGVEPPDAEQALSELEHAGLVSDSRFAEQRAGSLAERGKGDLAIRADLERQGVASEVAERAISALEPERERAARIVLRRGGGEKTARLLASRGFDEEIATRAANESVAPPS